MSDVRILVPQEELTEREAPVLIHLIPDDLYTIVKNELGDTLATIVLVRW